MMDDSKCEVESVSRTTVSTMGDSAGIVFNVKNGTLTLTLPYEVISDTQAALAHAQRVLASKRQALGAAETANLLHVQSVRARDLPDRQLHLQVNTESGIPFHFHVSQKMALQFSEALKRWLAEAG
jgi:hypothetical protein